MPKIEEEQIDAIKLFLRSKDIGGGWRQVSEILFPIFLERVPNELLEIDRANRKVRLSILGQVITQYVV